MSDNLPYAQLVQILTDLIDSKRSGTLFIHSECNHAVTFALDAGEIHAVFHGARRGRKAFPLICKITGGTYRFEASELNGISHELPPTHEILNLLRTQQSAETDRSPTGSLTADHTGISLEQKERLIQQLKSQLAVHLGPIANMVFEDALEEIGEFDGSVEQAHRLIDQLCLDIDNAKEVIQFKDKAYSLVSDTLND
ncbi:MAG: hypothetical protein QNJ78_01735 [Gammaproteobacteria bacterium]|nr:hypothetical protein [Gammaproteobacteria bacterium]